MESDINTGLSLIALSLSVLVLVYVRRTRRLIRELSTKVDQFMKYLRLLDKKKR